MIEKFSAENYGPLKKVELALTPLHALIGPNDSGKSTILRGIQDVVDAATTGAMPFRFDSAASLEVGLSGGIEYARSLAGTRIKPGTQETSWLDPNRNTLMIGPGLRDPAFLKEARWLSGARLVRFEADRLRAGGGLFTRDQQLKFLTERGSGLPSVYDYLRDHVSEGYEEIRRRFCELFPTVKTLKLQAISANEKVLSVTLFDGTEVPATQMSEGMLYFLGYAALRHLQGASVLLIEEPETGLHPSRIAEIMGILREISTSGSQVIIATHSPLVVNELKPEEVTVVTRDRERGTIATALKSTPRFDERSQIYALGELWLSYANGADEAPLLKGTARKGALGT
ncbi:MAG: ATP-binding protein [Deltaproteobacteria bacterium]|nr:ATP-binding protein [Deltaproteobacteria bacterium]